MKRTGQIKLMEEVGIMPMEVAARRMAEESNPERELSQAEEAIIRSYLRLNMNTGRSVLPLRKFMQDLEQKLITCSLLMHMGNQRKVASILGVKPSTLCEKLRRTNFDNLVLRFNNTGSRSGEFLIDFAQSSQQ